MADEITALRSALEAEKLRSSRLEHTVSDLKDQMGRMEISLEAEGERIAMTLSRKLEKLKAEKAKLAMDVEREEEYITNRLQKRLNEVTQEKIDLEQNIEIEQERLVNSLTRKLGTAQRESADLRRRMNSTGSPHQSPLSRNLDMDSERFISPKIDENSTVGGSVPASADSSSFVLVQLSEMSEEDVRSEFNNVKNKLDKAERDLKHANMEVADLQKANSVLREEIRRLRETVFVLKQKMRALHEETELKKSPVRHSVGSPEDVRFAMRARSQTIGASAGSRARLYRSSSYKGPRLQVGPGPSPERKPLQERTPTSPISKKMDTNPQ